MIIDLRDRVGGLDEGSVAPADGTAASTQDNPVQDAIGALIALGYRSAEAAKAVRAVESESSEREDLIRNALKFLSKTG